MKKYITLCFIVLCIVAGCKSETTDSGGKASSSQTKEEKLKAGYESCKLLLKESGQPSKVIGESPKHDPSIDAAEYEGTIFIIEGDVLYLCRDLNRECSKEGGINSGMDTWCESKSDASKIHINADTTYWNYHYGDGKGGGSIEKSSKSEFDQLPTLQESKKINQVYVYVDKTGDKLIAKEIFMAVK